VSGQRPTRFTDVRASTGLRLAGAAALLAAAAASYLLVPPAALPPPEGSWAPRPGVVLVRGVYHVHTRRSDGTGTLQSVAEAAARARLDFVIVTDHGDGTREPEPPAYHAGVLVVDGVEISTTRGHVVALDLPRTPYPLGGAPAAVVEDVVRLGGVAIAAHPDSAKPALAWSDWDLPIAGFEWLNADSEWREEPPLMLVRAILAYPVRPVESVVSVFDRPDRTLERWDRLGRQGRTLVGLAAADAHARLGWENGGEQVEPLLRLEVPSYETVFRAFSMSVELDRPFTADARADARRLVDAIRAGRVATIVDGIAGSPGFEFYAVGPGGEVPMGGEAAVGELRQLRARVAAPPGARVRLLMNGRVVAETSGLDLAVDRERLPPLDRGDRAVYRIEVVLARAPGQPPIPWIVSNPIYEGQGPQRGRPPSAESGSARRDVAMIFPAPALPPPRVEHDPASKGAIEPRATADGRRALAFRYALARGPRNAWVAAVLPLPPGGIPGTGAIELDLRAGQPMRLSIQVRANVPGKDARWRRSIYLDRTVTRVSVPVADLEPVAGAAGSSPGAADALLLVVDPTNTAPGAAGVVWIDRVAVLR
jgi:hypothetical protein